MKPLFSGFGIIQKYGGAAESFLRPLRLCCELKSAVYARSEDGSTVINQLLNKYPLEGIAMPYTMGQFRKDYLKAHLPEMDTDEVLSMFTPKDRLKGLAPKDRLKGLTPKDRLEGLDPEEIETYLKKLKMKTIH